MRKILWVVALCLLLGAGAYIFHSSKEDTNGAQSKSSSDAGASGKKGGDRNAPAPVGVATAKTGDVPIYLIGLGNITPRSTITVHTLVNGQLMRVLFQEGQMVKKDDLLASIDDRPYKAALEQAEGLLTRDQALLAEAKLDLERYRTLWKQDSIAKQQLDTQASLVKQYEGTVKNDQGQVDAAKTNLIYTRITSPVNGRVGLRQVDAGNIVHTTDTNGIVIVTELQPITALFTLPEDNIPDVFKHLTAGDKLSAEAWSRDNNKQLSTGVLTAVDNEVDPTTGTVKFRAEFANEDNALFPSQFVNIRLKLDTLKNVVTIPNSGVQRGTHGTFVYLVKPDKTVSVQNITLGPADGETVSVEKGLSAGDRIVIDGADALRDGSKIEIPADEAKHAAAKDGSPPKADDKAEAKPRHKHKKHPDDANKEQ